MQTRETSTSHLPKLRPESRLPGDMIKILDEIPLDLRGETITSFPPRELFREGARSGVPKPFDFREAGLGVIVSAREDGRRSEKLWTAGAMTTFAIVFQRSL